MTTAKIKWADRRTPVPAYRVARYVSGLTVNQVAVLAGVNMALVATAEAVQRNVWAVLYQWLGEGQVTGILLELYRHKLLTRDRVATPAQFRKKYKKRTMYGYRLTPMGRKVLKAALPVLARMTERSLAE